MSDILSMFTLINKANEIAQNSAYSDREFDSPIDHRFPIYTIGIFMRGDRENLSSHQHDLFH